MSKERNIRETLDMDNRNYSSRNDECRCNENQNINPSRYLTVANGEVLPQSFERNERNERNENNRNTCCCKRSLKKIIRYSIKSFNKKFNRLIKLYISRQEL